MVHFKGRLKHLISIMSNMAVIGRKLAAFCTFSLKIEKKKNLRVRLCWLPAISISALK